MAIKQDADEIQQRVCRGCSQTYKYPVLRSGATRFYCESCMGLPANIRATFEAFNKRLNALAGAVKKLEKAVGGPAAAKGAARGGQDG